MRVEDIDFRKDLEIIKVTLQAYKILSNPDCRAIGEYLLPKIVNTLEQIDQYKNTLYQEGTDAMIRSLGNQIEKGMETEFSLHGKATVRIKVTQVIKK